MLGLGGWLDGWLGEKLSYPFEQPDECERESAPQLKLHHRRTNSIKLLRISVIDDLFLRFRLSGLRDELCIFLHCGWLVWSIRDYDCTADGWSAAAARTLS